MATSRYRIGKPDLASVTSAIVASLQSQVEEEEARLKAASASPDPPKKKKPKKVVGVKKPHAENGDGEETGPIPTTTHPDDPNPTNTTTNEASSSSATNNGLSITKPKAAAVDRGRGNQRLDPAVTSSTGTSATLDTSAVNAPNGKPSVSRGFGQATAGASIAQKGKSPQRTATRKAVSSEPIREAKQTPSSPTARGEELHDGIWSPTGVARSSSIHNNGNAAGSSSSSSSGVGGGGTTGVAGTTKGTENYWGTFQPTFAFPFPTNTESASASSSSNISRAALLASQPGNDAFGGVSPPPSRPSGGDLIALGTRKQSVVQPASGEGSVSPAFVTSCEPAMDASTSPSVGGLTQQDQLSLGNSKNEDRTLFTNSGVGGNAVSSGSSSHPHNPLMFPEDGPPVEVPPARTASGIERTESQRSVTIVVEAASPIATAGTDAAAVVAPVSAAPLVPAPVDQQPAQPLQVEVETTQSSKAIEVDSKSTSDAPDGNRAGETALDNASTKSQPQRDNGQPAFHIQPDAEADGDEDDGFDEDDPRRMSGISIPVPAVVIARPYGGAGNVSQLDPRAGAVAPSSSSSTLGRAPQHSHHHHHQQPLVPSLSVELFDDDASRRMSDFVGMGASINGNDGLRIGPGVHVGWSTAPIQVTSQQSEIGTRTAAAPTTSVRAAPAPIFQLEVDDSGLAAQPQLMEPDSRGASRGHRGSFPEDEKKLFNMPSPNPPNPANPPLIGSGVAPSANPLNRSSTMLVEVGAGSPKADGPGPRRGTMVYSSTAVDREEDELIQAVTGRQKRKETLVPTAVELQPAMPDATTLPPPPIAEAAAGLSPRSEKKASKTSSGLTIQLPTDAMTSREPHHGIGVVGTRGTAKVGAELPPLATKGSFGSMDGDTPFQQMPTQVFLHDDSTLFSPNAHQNGRGAAATATTIESNQSSAEGSGTATATAKASTSDPGNASASTARASMSGSGREDAEVEGGAGLDKFKPTKNRNPLASFYGLMEEDRAPAPVVMATTPLSPSPTKSREGASGGRSPQHPPDSLSPSRLTSPKNSSSGMAANISGSVVRSATLSAEYSAGSRTASLLSAAGSVSGSGAGRTQDPGKDELADSDSRRRESSTGSLGSTAHNNVTLAIPEGSISLTPKTKTLLAPSAFQKAVVVASGSGNSPPSTKPSSPGQLALSPAGKDGEKTSTPSGSAEKPIAVLTTETDKAGATEASPELTPEEKAEKRRKDIEAILNRYDIENVGSVEASLLKRAMHSQQFTPEQRAVLLGNPPIQAHRLWVSDLQLRLNWFAQRHPELADGVVEKLQKVPDAIVKGGIPYGSYTATRMSQLLSNKRRYFADNAVRIFWDFLQLLTIAVFYCGTLYSNIVEWDFDPLGLKITYGVFSLFWLADFVLTTQLAVQNDHGRVVLGWKEIGLLRRKEILVDFIALLPIDFILQEVGIFPAFLTFRLIKQVKLATALRLMEIVNDNIITPAVVEFHFRFKPILLGLFWMTTFVHAVACIHMIIDIYFISPRQFPAYIQNLLWVLIVLSGINMSVFAYTIYDYLLIIPLMFLSILVLGYVVGKFGYFVLSSSISSQNTSLMRDTLNIVRHYKVPVSIQREILSYQMHVLNDDVARHSQNLEALPTRMQDEILTYIKVDAVGKVKIFGSASDACKMKLAFSLEKVIAEPDSEIVSIGQIGSEMYLIAHGYADVIGPTGIIFTTFSRGDYFGEMALVTPECKRTATIRALTYCDLWALSKESFLEALGDFPDFCQSFQEVMKERKVNLEHLLEAVEAAKKKRQKLDEEIKRQSILLNQSGEGSPGMPAAAAAAARRSVLGVGQRPSVFGALLPVSGSGAIQRMEGALAPKASNLSPALGPSAAPLITTHRATIVAPPTGLIPRQTALHKSHRPSTIHIPDDHDHPAPVPQKSFVTTNRFQARREINTRDTHNHQERHGDLQNQASRQNTASTVPWQTHGSMAKLGVSTMQGPAASVLGASALPAGSINPAGRMLTATRFGAGGVTAHGAGGGGGGGAVGRMFATASTSAMSRTSSQSVAMASGSSFVRSSAATPFGEPSRLPHPNSAFAHPDSERRSGTGQTPPVLDETLEGAAEAYRALKHRMKDLRRQAGLTDTNAVSGRFTPGLLGGYPTTPSSARSSLPRRDWPAEELGNNSMTATSVAGSLGLPLGSMARSPIPAVLHLPGGSTGSFKRPGSTGEKVDKSIRFKAPPPVLDASMSPTSSSVASAIPQTSFIGRTPPPVPGFDPRQSTTSEESINGQ